MDLRQYQKEYFKRLNGFSGIDIINEYECPNSQELHNMICGYGEVYDDMSMFDRAESIDYLKYERQLWKDWRRN